MFTAPKTKGSAAGVGLSSRVVAALKRQSARQAVERAEWGEAYEDDDLVFARENGAPLRPDWVLDRFHDLTEAAGLPRVRLHDLRHLAATLSSFTYEDVPDGVCLETMTFEDLGDGRTRVTGLSVVDTMEARDAMIASGMEHGVVEGYEKLDALLAQG